MGSSEEDRVLPPVPEPLKIFGKEFAPIALNPLVWIAQCGVLRFSILEEGGIFRGFINGDAMTGEAGCATREATRDALESEGRRIAREMLMMAGEMVAEKRAEFSERTIERYPVVFKERDP